MRVQNDLDRFHLVQDVVVPERSAFSRSIQSDHRNIPEHLGYLGAFDLKDEETTVELVIVKGSCRLHFKGRPVTRKPSGAQNNQGFPACAHQPQHLRLNRLRSSKCRKSTEYRMSNRSSFGIRALLTQSKSLWL